MRVPFGEHQTRSARCGRPRLPFLAFCLRLFLRRVNDERRFDEAFRHRQALCPRQRLVPLWTRHAQIIHADTPVPRARADDLARAARVPSDALRGRVVPYEGPEWGRARMAARHYLYSLVPCSRGDKQFVR